MTCPTDHPHNLTCYTAHRCRCDRCRAANTTYTANWRTRKKMSRTGHIPHGTYGGYTNYGCHCQPCTAAMRAKRAEQRAWAKLNDPGWTP